VNGERLTFFFILFHIRFFSEDGHGAAVLRERKIPHGSQQSRIAMLAAPQTNALHFGCACLFLRRFCLDNEVFFN